MPAVSAFWWSYKAPVNGAYSMILEISRIIVLYKCVPGHGSLIFVGCKWEEMWKEHIKANVSVLALKTGQISRTGVVFLCGKPHPGGWEQLLPSVRRYDPEQSFSPAPWWLVTVGPKFGSVPSTTPFTLVPSSRPETLRTFCHGHFPRFHWWVH